MEMFALPFGEISDRFTRSELVLMAWRSQEQHHQFKKKMKRTTSKNFGTETEGKKRKVYEDAETPEGLPDEYFNDEGEVDLSQVTGSQARQYLAHIGMPFPESGVSRQLVDEGDPIADAYRKKQNG